MTMLKTIGLKTLPVGFRTSMHMYAPPAIARTCHAWLVLHTSSNTNVRYHKLVLLNEVCPINRIVHLLPSIW